MRQTQSLLLNTTAIELLPAALLSARSNADARVLAQADWLLRRKRDGKYLAAQLPHGLMPLIPRLAREPGLDEALDLLHTSARRTTQALDAVLPIDGLQRRLTQLGIGADAYVAQTGLDLIAEPAALHLAGRDRFARPLWLSAGAARAWRQLRAAALREDVVLDAISGYRSHDYQLGIFERKFARGLTLAQILAVNAAPGFSEHHSGDAVDIGTPGEPPAEESFESTAAFAWLQTHAGRFGFRLSYPRDNPHGIVYEPWHWRWWPA
ncbi:M15 family metallopeptidase [Xanthomonas campestris pv. raphani]|uniref:M15 family metallopeptidase n=1 Tax=Xanthomonas campestris TaxID=339 RepID=UPI001E48F0F6|nr:M15 family metallopeptidase [Xanthomonas campestris]MCC8685460.1 D-alanyl-D-alanine carboxypeptidase family protein [Xanthomonas campestris]MCC8688707.1 D-alanyl-D-alanine carboxypeptidase family protein [Xanthomonas campestris]MCW1999520.1 D-alanyl-D-alanine carboxypeptidase [Xanthomonas campestris]MEA9679096.1 M15 family metallopeptidase [Xanthomonas campestris pv. raphani]MEA9698771.1 M15 family metallopeptidase [Xanthomonas campestris pv. raphani]